MTFYTVYYILGCKYEHALVLCTILIVCSLLIIAFFLYALWSYCDNIWYVLLTYSASKYKDTLILCIV